MMRVSPNLFTLSALRAHQVLSTRVMLTDYTCDADPHAALLIRLRLQLALLD